MYGYAVLRQLSMPHRWIVENWMGTFTEPGVSDAVPMVISLDDHVATPCISNRISVENGNVKGEKKKRKKKKKERKKERKERKPKERHKRKKILLRCE